MCENGSLDARIHMRSDSLIATVSWGPYGETGDGDRESPKVYSIATLGFSLKNKRSSHKTKVERRLHVFVLKAP